MNMKTIKYILPALALVMVSCENFFDEKQLGNTGYKPSDVRTDMIYTLTADDLGQITKKGSEYEKRALALCTAEDSTAYQAWKDIATLKAFNENADADIYVPTFMANTFPYLDKGTIFKVYYPYYKGKTARVLPFMSATGYTLTDEDYKTIWGGRGADYLTTTAEPNIPEFLAAKFKTATEGKIIVLTYKSLNTDPDTIYAPLPYECTIAQLLEAKETVEHQLKGVVGSIKSTIYGRFYLVDGKDSIYVYGLSDENGNKVWKDKGIKQGDQITIRGKYSQVNEEPQLNDAVYVSHTAGSKAIARRMVTKEPLTQDTIYKSVIYQLNQGTWTLYTNDQVKAYFALPTDIYDALGSTSIANPQAVIGKYLRLTYPYAAEKDIYLVAYNGSMGMTADEFTYDGTDFVMNTGYTTEEMNFVRKDNWVADISTYYTTPFVNNGQADFTIQHINLDGLSYVWRYQASYGMTASAYVSGVNHPVEDWLISPSIRLKKSVNPKMHFDHAIRYGNQAYNKDWLKVMVTNNYTGDVTTTEWEHLQFPDSIPDGSSWLFTSTGDFDLSKYNNQSIVIAFQYNTTTGELTSAPTWEIQNLLVYEPETTDKKEE